MDAAAMFVPAGYNDGEGKDAEQADDTALFHGRLSSADVYLLGPVTCDRTCDILKQCQEKKDAEREEKEAHANARKRKRAAVVEKRALLAREVIPSITSQAVICSLKLAELQAVLHYRQPECEEQHRRLLGKPAFVQAVIALFPNLPAGNAAAAAAATQRRRAPTASSSRRAAAKEVKEADKDNKESDAEEAEVDEDDGNELDDCEY
eukprot:6201266-Pleurochrysis_carterae.AAC.3